MHQRDSIKWYVSRLRHVNAVLERFLWRRLGFGVPLFITALFIIALCSTSVLIGCTPTPPDHRAPVSAPIYTGGNAKNGEVLYEEYCLQCHKLQPGKNKKGPQLIGVYEAPSASLEDYNYSSDMSSANLIWDAETLDTYIEDPLAMMKDTRMLSDPIPESHVRHDIIAYLSTLGRAEEVAEIPDSTTN